MDFPRSQLFFKVWQPDVQLRDHPTPSSAAVHLQFQCRRIHRLINRSDDGTASIIDEFEDPTGFHAQCFDPYTFTCYSASYQILTAILSALQVSLHHQKSVIDEVIRHGRWIHGNRVPNAGRKVIPLFVDIKMVTEYECGEEELVRMVEMQSAAEAERGGYGMVPASERSIKALEKVTMESEGESCMVCLEDLPRGSHVTRMPCSHLFHGDCITRWLENSHSCPICRFEMPTN